MIEVNATLFMLLWELVLLLIAAGVVIAVQMVIRRRREQACIDELIVSVKGDLDYRKKKIRTLLEKKYGYSGEQLENTVRKITLEEKRCYQTLANLFKTRDILVLGNLNITFEETVEPYYELEIPELKDTEGAESVVDSGAVNEEVVRLKEENQELSDELRVTMNTISRMLNEYSSMLSEPDDDNNQEALPDEDNQETESLIGMFTEDDSNENESLVVADEEMPAADVDDLLQELSGDMPEPVEKDVLLASEGDVIDEVLDEVQQKSPDEIIDEFSGVTADEEVSAGDIDDLLQEIAGDTPENINKDKQ